jgi:hypothetical protein
VTKIQAVLLDHVREKLFDSLKNMPRFRHLHARSVCGPECRCFGRVTFESVPLADPTAPQRERLALLQAFAPAGAEVQARRHSGRCDACGCERAKCGALVVVVLEGERFTREYAL